MAERPLSKRANELLRQIDALERQLAESRAKGTPMGPPELVPSSGGGATEHWMTPMDGLRAGLKPNWGAIAKNVDAMMAIQGPAQLLLPPQYRGKGPAGTANEVITKIGEIVEDRRPLPAEQAAKNMTGSAEGIITQPLWPYEDSSKEARFQTEYRTLAVKSGIDPDPDNPMHKYDYRRAWEAGAMNTKDGHFPSEFKLPGHPRIIVDGRDTRTGRQVRNAQTKRRFR